MEREALSVPGVDFETLYVTAGVGVQLRVMRWLPVRRRGCPILFVPGWASAPEGWLDLIRVLAPEHPLYYLETREKASAHLEQVSLQQFRVSALADELRSAVVASAINVADTLVMGSSLGASILLEAMKHGKLEPRAAFLIGPTCHFYFPWWAYPIMRLPATAYTLVKYLALWYLRTFRVDVSTEPEQMRRYEETLLVADPIRIKLSARAVAGFTVWEHLDTIQARVAVAFAPTDTLHGARDIERLLEALPFVTPVACPSNKYMHSSKLKLDIESFLASLQRAS